jgi:hypothetical protein
MGEPTIDGSVVAPRASYPLRRRVAAWPALAAAPTFAVMAIVITLPGDAGLGMICAAAPLSLSGMAPMYLLMSLFHSAPWLKLIASRLKTAQPISVNKCR